MKPKLKKTVCAAAAMFFASVCFAANVSYNTKAYKEVNKLMAAGNYEEAGKYADNALANAQKKFGMQHAVISDLLCLKAKVYSAQNNYEQAIETLAKAVETDQKAVKETDVLYARHIIALANAYISSARFDDAQKVLQKELDKNRKTLLYLDRRPAPAGSSSAALQPEQQIPKKFSINLNIPDYMQKMVEVYLRQKNIKEAMSYAMKTVSVVSSMYGTESDELLSALYNLSRIFSHHEDGRMSEPFNQMAKKTREDISKKQRSGGGINQNQNNPDGQTDGNPQAR